MRLSMFLTFLTVLIVLFSSVYVFRNDLLNRPAKPEKVGQIQEETVTGFIPLTAKEKAAQDKNGYVPAGVLSSVEFERVIFKANEAMQTSKDLKAYEERLEFAGDANPRLLKAAYDSIPEFMEVIEEHEVTDELMKEFYSIHWHAMNGS